MSRSYSKEDLDRAVSAVRHGGFSINAASKENGVPFGTLWRRINSKVSDERFSRGPEPAFSASVELEIKHAVQEMQDLGYGLSAEEVRNLALKVDSKLPDPFFKGKLPSHRWLQRFCDRQGLSLRKPESLSLARAKMSSIKVMDEFFETYSKKVNELKVGPNEIYNVDESGLQIVSKGRKIIAKKGSKNVIKKKSGERSETITVVGCANATGCNIMPPLLIFRGESLNLDITKNCPTGTIFAYTPKGYMISEVFVEWFKRFCEFIPPKRPVLLLLDGHGTHITLEVIHLARENNITLLCFPPHTTHLLQPMDVGVFASLKSDFACNSDKEMRKNNGESLNRYDFCTIFRDVWYSKMTPSNIVGGFSGSGIWPVDKSKIPNDKLFDEIVDEEQEEVTGNDTEATGESEARTTVNVSSTIRSLLTSFRYRPGSASPLTLKVTSTISSPSKTFDPMDMSVDVHVEHSYPGPSTSKEPPSTNSHIPSARFINPPTQNPGPSRNPPSVENPSKSSLTPSRDKTSSACSRLFGPELSPVTLAVREMFAPRPSQRKRSSRAITKTRVLTSDEFIREEEEKKKIKLEKEMNKGNKKPKKMKILNKKNKCNEEANVKVIANEEGDQETTEDETNVPCDTCKQMWTDDTSGRQWIKCMLCQKWYHQTCQGLKNTEKPKTFNCDQCKK